MIRKTVAGAALVVGALTSFAGPAMAETGPYVYDKTYPSKEEADIVGRGSVEHYHWWSRYEAHQLPDGSWQLVYWKP